jgi:hypothetical protein
MLGSVAVGRLCGLVGIRAVNVIEFVVLGGTEFYKDGRFLDDGVGTRTRRTRVSVVLQV